MFSLPVAGSRRIQRTCRPVEAQFIICIVPLHSTGGEEIESSCINRWLIAGRSVVCRVSTRVFSGALSDPRLNRSSSAATSAWGLASTHLPPRCGSDLRGVLELQEFAAPVARGCRGRNLHQAQSVHLIKKAAIQVVEPA